MQRPLCLSLVALTALVGCDLIGKLSSNEPTPDQKARALAARGRTAYAAGQLEAASQLFEQAAALVANDPEPQLALGQIYSKLGNDGQAILSLKRAVELDPGNPEARTSLADLYLRQGKPEAAAEQLRKALETAGDQQANPAVRRRLADALLRGGNPDAAEAVVEELQLSGDTDPDTLALLAEILIAKGQEERAVALLDAAVSGGGGSAAVRVARARYFASRGRVNEAVREYDLAAEAAPEDVEIAMARARALATTHRFEEAAAALNTLVTARPTDSNAQAALAEVRLLAGDLAGAKEAAEAVLVRQARNARALYVRARAMEEEGGDDLVRVVHAYREALAADAGQTETLSRLWPILLRLGERNDAISVLERLLFSGEATQDEEVELAALYLEAGISLTRAKSLVAAALKRDPGNRRLEAMRRELEVKARNEPGRSRGGGIQVLKGGRP